MNKIPRYITNNCWNRVKSKPVSKGDYVVATKYTDGDPGDQFCIGFYDSSFDHYGQTRHLVVDGSGQQFRRGGFRRVERVGRRRGEWMVRNIDLIQRMQDEHSVWHWYRATWDELAAAAPSRQGGEMDKSTHEHVANVLRCECGEAMLSDGRTMKTMVGYYSPLHHDHDDNCRTRLYYCPACGSRKTVSKRNRCPSCDWVGKLTCFCHEGEKVDMWPDTEPAPNPASAPR